MKRKSSNDSVGSFWDGVGTEPVVIRPVEHDLDCVLGMLDPVALGGALRRNEFTVNEYVARLRELAMQDEERSTALAALKLVHHVAREAALLSGAITVTQARGVVQKDNQPAVEITVTGRSPSGRLSDTRTMLERALSAADNSEQDESHKHNKHSNPVNRISDNDTGNTVNSAINNSNSFDEEADESLTEESSSEELFDEELFDEESLSESLNEPLQESLYECDGCDTDDVEGVQSRGNQGGKRSSVQKTDEVGVRPGGGTSHDKRSASGRSSSEDSGSRAGGDSGQVANQPSAGLPRPSETGPPGSGKPYVLGRREPSRNVYGGGLFRPWKS